MTLVAIKRLVHFVPNKNPNNQLTPSVIILANYHRYSFCFHSLDLACWSHLLVVDPLPLLIASRFISTCTRYVNITPPVVQGHTQDTTALIVSDPSPCDSFELVRPKSQRYWSCRCILDWSLSLSPAPSLQVEVSPPERNRIKHKEHWYSTCQHTWTDLHDSICKVYHRAIRTLPQTSNTFGESRAPVLLWTSQEWPNCVPSC